MTKCMLYIHFWAHEILKNKLFLFFFLKLTLFHVDPTYLHLHIFPSLDFSPIMENNKNKEFLPNYSKWKKHNIRINFLENQLSVNILVGKNNWVSKRRATGKYSNARG